jgi:hypothetical protein
MMGRVIENVPNTVESIFNTELMGRKRANKKINQEARVPVWLNRRIFLLPYRSDHLPKMGAPTS